MKKTQLFITVKKSGVYFTPYERETIQIDSEHTRTHRTELFSIPMQTTRTQGQHTDLFFAVCEKYVPMLVYTALQTTYAKSPSETIRQLMNQCIDYAKTTGQTHEQFEQCLAYEDTIVSYMSKKSTASEKARQTQYAQDRQTTYTKEHTYTMVADTTGHRYKIECVPYTTQHNTKYGMVVNEEHIAQGTDIEDLIQTGYLAMCELLDMGLINSVNDFWNYRTYVYKCVNHVIMSERAVRVKCENIEPHTIKGQHTADSRQEKHLLRVEQENSRQQTIKKLWSMVEQGLDKQANRDNIKAVFYMHYVQGQDTRTIADELNKGQTQIMRYINSVKKALNNEQAHSLLIDLLA